MYVPFWPPRARKTAETAHFGPSAGKTELMAATAPKFRSFYPLELFGLIHKRPGHDPFFADNPFSPTDEFAFMGLVVRSCHFDVTACAEARQLALRARRASWLDNNFLPLCIDTPYIRTWQLGVLLRSSKSTGELAANYLAIANWTMQWTCTAFNPCKLHLNSTIKP